MGKGPQPRLTLQEASAQFYNYSLYTLPLFDVKEYCTDKVVTDLYILSLTIIGSILLYPAGGLAYIDALFFASGVATQSGLNTYAHVSVS